MLHFCKMGRPCKDSTATVQSCAFGIHESAQNKTASPHAVSDWCRKRGHCHFGWSQGMGDTQLKLDPKALITPWLLPAPSPPPPTSPSSSSLLLIHSRVPPGRPGHQYDTQKECVGSGTSTGCLCHSNPSINLCKFCPLPLPPTSPSLSPSHPELALEWCYVLSCEA